jgi:hypothetical protein
LHVAQIVNTEQLQHYIPSKHGFRYIIVDTLPKGDKKVVVVVVVVVVVIIIIIIIINNNNNNNNNNNV